MDISTEIGDAINEMKRTTHNLESLEDTLDFLNGEIARVTAKRIEWFGARIVIDRDCGKVTRAGLRAGRATRGYDMDGASEARELLEREAASHIIQIAEAKVERIEAAKKMAKACVYD